MGGVLQSWLKRRLNSKAGAQTTSQRAMIPLGSLVSLVRVALSLSVGGTRISGYESCGLPLYGLVHEPNATVTLGSTLGRHSYRRWSTSTFGGADAYSYIPSLLWRRRACCARLRRICVTRNKCLLLHRILLRPHLPLPPTLVHQRVHHGSRASPKSLSRSLALSLCMTSTVLKRRARQGAGGSLVLPTRYS